MAFDRKAYFIDALKQHYQETIASARKAEVDAAKAADEIRKQARNKDDAKAAVEPGRMAGSHEKRRHRAAPDAKIGLGAMIDVSIETDDGSEERTLFMLPVGAGTELSGPGGDGFLSVIGPKSPVGMALMGACAGDEVEVIVAGRDREWSIVDVC